LDLVDQAVGKVLDQFEIEHNLFRRWVTMTLDQFDASVKTLLNSVTAMTLATSVDARPWATDVYFVANGRTHLLLLGRVPAFGKLSLRRDCASPSRAMARDQRAADGGNGRACGRRRGDGARIHCLFCEVPPRTRPNVEPVSFLSERMPKQ
jgi:hypothetical protein